MLNAKVYIIVRKTNGDIFVLWGIFLRPSSQQVSLPALPPEVYYDEFGELPLPPEEADFELDRTTKTATLTLETLGPSPNALCARL